MPPTGDGDYVHLIKMCKKIVRSANNKLKRGEKKTKKQKQNLHKFTAVTFVCSDTLEAINHAYN